MSYDVGAPIVALPAPREGFRELDRRVFDPRVLRLTKGESGLAATAVKPA